MPTEKKKKTGTKNAITFPLLNHRAELLLLLCNLPSRLFTVTVAAKWGDYRALVDICTLLSVFLRSVHTKSIKYVTR